MKSESIPKFKRDFLILVFWGNELKTLYKGVVIFSVGITLLILSFLVPWDMFLPPWNEYHYSDWSISPGVVDSAHLNLIWGTSVRGRIECSGPYYNDINFSITDSGDHIVFNPGRVNSGYEFRWQAWSNDFYYFKFYNTRGWTKTVGYSWYLYLYFHVFLLLGTILTVIGTILTLKEVFTKSETSKKNPSSKHPLDEYREGNDFSQTYIKVSWTATSIFLPVCFGLIAVSYSEPLLDLGRISLVPLAIASASLYFIWWLYTNRYSGYNRSIWRRLQDLEGQAGMYLHSRINEEDESRYLKWKIRHVNWTMLRFLTLAWVFRIASAPIR